MEFEREYMGRWVDPRAGHGQVVRSQHCSISEEFSTVASLTLDHPYVREFSYIRLRGECMPIDNIGTDPDRRVGLYFDLFVDEERRPESRMRCSLSFDERRFMVFRKRERVPVPFGNIEFPVNIHARNSLRIEARSSADCGEILLAHMRFEVGYTVPEPQWSFDGYNTFPEMPGPPQYSLLMDDYRYMGIRDQDFFAQQVYTGLGIPSQYISGVPKEELPDKHKGFYVEKENQDRRECLFCGEPLKRVDLYMICEECDHVG